MDLLQSKAKPLNRLRPTRNNRLLLKQVCVLQINTQLVSAQETWEKEVFKSPCVHLSVLL